MKAMSEHPEHPIDPRPERIMNSRILISTMRTSWRRKTTWTVPTIVRTGASPAANFPTDVITKAKTPCEKIL